MCRIALLIILMGIRATAFGDSTTSLDHLFSLSLSELLSMRITSATRHEESLESVPASVTVYTREQIRALGIDRLGTLMNFVPGFQSQRGDGSSIHYPFSSRGIRNANGGREVLILLDGQRLNTSWSGGVYTANGIINLDKISRVEFIRGPGSAIYGSNAYLGVINLVSQANNEATVALATLNGSGTLRQASVQWQQEYRLVTVELFVHAIDDEGQRLNAYNPFKSALVDTRDPSLFKELYLKAKTPTLNLSVYHSINQTEQFYTEGFLSNEYNSGDTASSYLDLQYKTRLSQDVTLNGKASVSQKVFDLSTLISPAPPPNELGISGGIEEREPQVEVSLSYIDNEGDKALAGVEWRRPKIVDSDANLFGISNQYLAQAPLAHRTIYGLFVQYQADINHNMHYVLGLRQDDYSNFGSHLSPRGGLIWQADDRNTFKWLYGESFRAPSIIETSVINNAAFVANPDLEPEVSRTIEFIWQIQQPDSFLATTLYYTELDNVITNAQTTPIERYNTGHEELAGIELEWHSQWSDKLSSRLNASWIFDGPSKANSEAEFFAGVSLIYTHEKFSGALMLNHHGTKQDSFVNNQVEEEREVPQRSFLDAHYRHFLPHDIELFLHLNNILDQDYDSVSQRTNNSQGVANRGVSLLSGLRWNF